MKVIDPGTGPGQHRLAPPADGRHRGPAPRLDPRARREPARGREPGLAARSLVMTRALVVNAGSSSLKLRLLDPRDEITAALDLDEWDGSPDTLELTSSFNGPSGVSAVGHGVAHGGSRFTRAAVIGDQVTSAIRDLTDLAPPHQPRVLAGNREQAPHFMPGCPPRRPHTRCPAAQVTCARSERPPPTAAPVLGWPSTCTRNGCGGVRTVVVTARRDVEIARQIPRVTHVGHWCQEVIKFSVFAVGTKRHLPAGGAPQAERLG